MWKVVNFQSIFCYISLVGHFLSLAFYLFISHFKLWTRLERNNAKSSVILIVSFFQLTVLAIDFGETRLSSRVSVHITVSDVNDNPPKFITAPNATFTISYQSPEGQTVGVVSATDKDFTDHGQLRYGLNRGRVQQLF